MRFEDSPELFGRGCGISTRGDIQCQICGIKYNEGADKNEDYDNYLSVGHTEFAGLDVCHCCFEKIENEIWARRTEVISWLKRRLESIKKHNDKELELINTIKE